MVYPFNALGRDGGVVYMGQESRHLTASTNQIYRCVIVCHDGRTHSLSPPFRGGEPEISASGGYIR
jgi:hypothetical protein